MRLCCRGNMPPCNASRQLNELQYAHALQNIISHSNLLRKHLRQALREGGQVCGDVQLCPARCLALRRVHGVSAGQVAEKSFGLSAEREGSYILARTVLEPPRSQ